MKQMTLKYLEGLELAVQTTPEELNAQIRLMAAPKGVRTGQVVFRQGLFFLVSQPSRVCAVVVKVDVDPLVRRAIRSPWERVEPAETSLAHPFEHLQ